LCHTDDMNHTPSLKEEMATVVVCVTGLLLSIAGLAVMAASTAVYGDVWQVVSFSLYGASLVTLFTASLLFHAVQELRVKRFFEIADQSAIYLLIAGTYMPFTLVTLRGVLGWSMFGVIWGLALVGILVTWLVPAEKLKLFSSLSYLAMGWLIVIGAQPLLERLPLAGILWLVAGGVLYSAGVPLFFFKQRPYAHTVWHLFVLAGAVCHYIVVQFYVTPILP